MSRTGVKVTLSLQPGDKENLENLAVKFGCTWGDRPNVSELISEIAKGDRITIQWADSRPVEDPQRRAIQGAIAMIQEGLAKLTRSI